MRMGISLRGEFAIEKRRRVGSTHDGDFHADRSDRAAAGDYD